MHNSYVLLAIRIIFSTMFFPNLGIAAQNLTWDSWTPYRDRFGLIHSVPVDKTTRNPSTNNGLLYTSEACVIMQLRNVNYDRRAIVSTIASCEVKPGLFRRSPTNPQDQEGPDDYIGLGALAGVCGFHDIGRSILHYGRDGVVTNNYNNVDPNKFTWTSWMGRFSGADYSLKARCGEKPNTAEFVIWSAALEFSARDNMGTHSPQDPWLQSWLMVLTYEASEFRSNVADAAVTNWWGLLRQRYPGGIKQAMTEYLSAGAQGNPLSEFIEDFKDARTPVNKKNE